MTSAGVFMNRSIAGVVKMPTAVSMTVKMIVSMIDVCTASWTLSGSFAP